MANATLQQGYFKGIELARGYIDDVVCTPDELAIQGWMLHPDHETDRLRVFLDEVKRVAPLWDPNLDDGVLINFAPLWRRRSVAGTRSLL